MLFLALHSTGRLPQTGQKEETPNQSDESSVTGLNPELSEKDENEKDQTSRRVTDLTGLENDLKDLSRKQRDDFTKCSCANCLIVCKTTISLRAISKYKNDHYY